LHPSEVHAIEKIVAGRLERGKCLAELGLATRHLAFRGCQVDLGHGTGLHAAAIDAQLIFRHLQRVDFGLVVLVRKHQLPERGDVVVNSLSRGQDVLLVRELLIVASNADAGGVVVEPRVLEKRLGEVDDNVGSELRVEGEKGRLRIVGTRFGHRDVPGRAQLGIPAQAGAQVRALEGVDSNARESGRAERKGADRRAPVLGLGEADVEVRVEDRLLDNDRATAHLSVELLDVDVVAQCRANRIRQRELENDGLGIESGRPDRAFSLGKRVRSVGTLATGGVLGGDRTMINCRRVDIRSGGSTVRQHQTRKTDSDDHRVRPRRVFSEPRLC
jgi:hypothetical protein